MAQTLINERVIIKPWQSWLKVVAIGAALGVIAWLLTLLIGQYIVDPLACRQLANASMCVNSIPIAGNIANILVGAGAVLILTRLLTPRALIIAIAPIALLWDLAGWTLGLPRIEALGWSILLYGLSYGLFAWISRYSRTWVVVTVAVLIIVIIRIALVLFG